MENFYRALGTKSTASKEEIKQCYHKLIREYHPDKNNDVDEEYYLIDKAWKTLSNDLLRRSYDAKLMLLRTPRAPIQEEVILTDMAYNTDDEKYTWLCRCGGYFALSADGATGDKAIVSCDSCSLTIIVQCDSSPKEDDS